MLQISISRTAWPSACCRLEQRNQSQTTLEREMVGAGPSTYCLNTSPLSARGMVMLSCKTATVSPRTLFLLQLESSPTSNHQAAIILKTGLET